MSTNLFIYYFPFRDTEIDAQLPKCQVHIALCTFVIVVLVTKLCLMLCDPVVGHD